MPRVGVAAVGPPPPPPRPRDEDVSEFLGLLDLASPLTAVLTVLAASAACLFVSGLMIANRELRPEIDSSAL